MIIEKNQYWTLSFRASETEKSYKEWKSESQKTALHILMIFCVLISLFEWVLNPYDREIFDKFTMGYELTLLFTTLVFILVSKKRPQYLEILVNVVIIYFIIGFFELAKQYQEQWDTLFSFNMGCFLEYILAVMILARLSWINSVVTYIAITVIFTAHFTSFDDNDDVKFFPFLIQIQNLFMLSIASYFMEKRDRERFIKIKNFENSLCSFKELITDALPFPILILNEENLVFYNKETEKFFDLTAKNDIYHRLNSMVSFDFDHDRWDEKKRSVDSLSEELQPFKESTNNQSFHDILNACFKNLSENQRLFLDLHCYYRNPFNGEISYYDMNLKNLLWDGMNSIMIIISENRAIEKIQMLKDQADFKNKILATVSHDLRTPLYGVIGMISASEEMSTEENVKKGLNIALRSSQLLQLIINDIIDYGLILRGTIILKNERFSLWNAINEISELIKFQADKKGLNFLKENKASGKRNEEPFIQNDQNRVKQVLLNVISNALKFTEKGFIKVVLEKEAAENCNCKSQKAYIIKVIDTGKGIKEKDIPGLFTIFNNSSEKNSSKKKNSDMGFGLAITKKLMEKLNEDQETDYITVDSEFGVGSTFTLRIKSIENIDKIEVHSENIECDFSDSRITLPSFQAKSIEKPFFKKIRNKINILLVDDDQINIMVGTSYLKCIKHVEFDTAMNGVQALEKIKTNSKLRNYFDVILMDCNMPVMDGFQATRTIRALITSGAIPNVVIIACTANASFEDKEKCFKSGMDDIIIKPFTRKELEEKIPKCN